MVPVVPVYLFFHCLATYYKQSKPHKHTEEIWKKQAESWGYEGGGFVDRLNYKYGGWTEDFRAAVILPGNIVVIG